LAEAFQTESNAKGYWARCFDTVSILIVFLPSTASLGLFAYFLDHCVAILAAFY